jgi:hypothetical protein
MLIVVICYFTAGISLVVGPMLCLYLPIFLFKTCFYYYCFFFSSQKVIKVKEKCRHIHAEPKGYHI